MTWKYSRRELDKRFNLSGQGAWEKTFRFSLLAKSPPQGQKPKSKEMKLVDKAYPYLMELANICLANMSGITINVSGGHFEYVSDRSELNDKPTPTTASDKDINVPIKKIENININNCISISDELEVIESKFYEVIPVLNHLQEVISLKHK